MSTKWDLPEVTINLPTGRECFTQAISDLTEPIRLRFMMLRWRIWHVQNELVHYKPAPSIDVSCHFLSSYVALLNSIAINPNADHTKGKFPAQVSFPLVAPTCDMRHQEHSPWSPPRLDEWSSTWVKYDAHDPLPGRKRYSYAAASRRRGQADGAKGMHLWIEL